ncbi:hypothetical protein [Pedobacter panaciterrae]
MKIVRIKSPFLFFCFLFSFATSKVQAQTDFVIMNDGTKLMGEIKNQNLKKVKFIGSGEKKVRKFGPTDITEVYKTGRETFRSVGLPGNKGRFFYKFWKMAGSNCMNILKEEWDVHLLFPILMEVPDWVLG